MVPELFKRDLKGFGEENGSRSEIKPNHSSYLEPCCRAGCKQQRWSVFRFDLGRGKGGVAQEGDQGRGIPKSGYGGAESSSSTWSLQQH